MPKSRLPYLLSSGLALSIAVAACAAMPAVETPAAQTAPPASQIQMDLKAGLQITSAYRENSRAFQKAVSRFDLFWLSL